MSLQHGFFGVFWSYVRVVRSFIEGNNCSISIGNESFYTTLHLTPPGAHLQHLSHTRFTVHLLHIFSPFHELFCCKLIVTQSFTLFLLRLLIFLEFIFIYIIIFFAIWFLLFYFLLFTVFFFFFFPFGQLFSRAQKALFTFCFIGLDLVENVLT